MHTLIYRVIAVIAFGLGVFLVSAVEAQTLTAVLSRKIHAGVGAFDLPIAMGAPITGAITVEPRAIGTGHSIVFQFDQPITSAGTVTVVDVSSAAIGSASAIPSGNNVIVTLTGVPDNRRVTISLTNVNGIGTNATASVGFLVGDVNKSRAVETNDISAVKAVSGMTVNATNFLMDLNADGEGDAVDVATVKARLGNALVLAGQQALLTIVKAGTGSGTLLGTGVLFSSPAVIDCPIACLSRFAYFDVNTAVGLSATPSAGSTFSGWSGLCASGTITLVADSTCTATFTKIAYAVTPSAGANGTISPATIQTVNPGAAVTFTVTPNAGYTASVGGTCGGTLVGTSYTTNAVTAACTVVATFTAVNFTVTPSAGTNGVITPSTAQTVLKGTTTAFTVSPNANYTPSVSGTCGGTLSGLTYTTNPVTANCTVVASFVRNSYTVTPSAGLNGTMSPATAQTVLNGATKAFVVTPSTGYSANVGGTCGGTLTGTNFTTNAITGNCSVIATFASTTPKYVSTTGSDTTGNGTINNPWQTIGKGVSTLVSGETLIVKNGTYSGIQNFITGVPSGTATKYTTIAAETPMGVRIQSVASLGVTDNQLNLSGNYIKVDGFIFEMMGTTNPAFTGSVAGNFNTVSRAIFKRGGDIDAFGGLLEVTGSDNLFEDMAGTGACAICFKQGGATASTQRNIWRRVIGRFDYSNSTQPKATFATFGGASTPATVRDHLYQNVIAIDGQNPGNLGGAEKMGGFYAAQNTANITLQGSMVLNEGAGNAGMFLRELGSINNSSHSVVWDLRNGLAGATGLIGGNADHLTIGGTIPGAAVDLITSAASSLLKPGTNPANLLNNTPGAIVLKQYGTSGTRWGQTGYDQITTVDLWPWPYQDTIKSVFREANNVPAGNSPALNDTFRGFSANGTALYGGGITLTSYIWEYLGAPCPSTACVTYTVTPSASANGSISPATVQSVLPNGIVTFTVTPSPGYIVSMSGTCGGTLTNTTYTTFPITANCTVVATFLSAAPLVLYTDITSGPNTGGENNNGIYLSIFGKNFGSTGLGTTTQVFINNVEVSRYISLGTSKGRTDIQQITVQIGALGNPAAGTPLPIKVVVGGASSNTNQTFIVNPGKIYFVSLTGSDSTGVAGSITSPYRTVQRDNSLNNNGTVGCPAASGNQTLAQTGVWGLVQPGDFIVMRGGTWNDVSKNNFFLVTQNKSGTVPTGALGTGPITIMGYPGETAFINRVNTQGDGEAGGGISGADTARQTLYGCSSRITITNLKVESGENDGPINTQNGASNLNGQYWRVVNNEMSGVSCNNNTYCKGGGVSGAGVGNYWVGNYVHDMNDKIASPCPGNIGCGTDFENHGFYMEGVGDYEVAYNRIENIHGGNGIQTNGTAATTGGDYSVTNAKIHHNIVNSVGKHGINIGNISSTGIVVHDNVVMNTDVGGIRFSSDQLVGAKVYNNTFYNTDRLGIGSPRAALMNDGTLTSGSLEIRNNIFIPGVATRLYESGSIGFAAVAATMSNNLWFSGTGSFSGSANKTTNPLFISTALGAENLRLQSTSSPAYCTGTNLVASVATTDFDLIGRPQGVCFSMGAYEFH